jgi:chromosomal replication initiation ATPase DnaA
MQSLPAIGRFFGGFDHTTVLHAIRAVERRMAAQSEQRKGSA